MNNKFNDSQNENSRSNSFNDKKYTLQGLLSKITKSEPNTIANASINLSELFPDANDSQK